MRGNASLTKKLLTPILPTSPLYGGIRKNGTHDIVNLIDDDDGKCGDARALEGIAQSGMLLPA